MIASALVYSSFLLSYKCTNLLFCTSAFLQLYFFLLFCTSAFLQNYVQICYSALLLSYKSAFLQFCFSTTLLFCTSAFLQLLFCFCTICLHLFFTNLLSYIIMYKSAFLQFCSAFLQLYFCTSAFLQLCYSTFAQSPCTFFYKSAFIHNYVQICFSAILLFPMYSLGNPAPLVSTNVGGGILYGRGG